MAPVQMDGYSPGNKCMVTGYSPMTDSNGNMVTGFGKLVEQDTDGYWTVAFDEGGERQHINPSLITITEVLQPTSALPIFDLLESATNTRAGESGSTPVAGAGESASSPVNGAEESEGKDHTGLILCCGCFCCFCVVIGLCVLLPCSISILEWHQLGLDFNSITGSLDAVTVYEGGRHLIGLGHKFIVFPATTVTVMFTDLTGNSCLNQVGAMEGLLRCEGPLQLMSQDGQPIVVEGSFVYKLQKDNIGKLYNSYSTGFYQAIGKIAEQQIKDVCSRHSNVDFFQEREMIIDEVQGELSPTLSDTYVDLQAFNLWSVDFSDMVNSALINKLVMAQLRATTQLQQTSKKVAADTSVILAQSVADSNVIKAQAFATGQLTQGIAETDAFGQVMRKSGEILLELSQQLGWDGGTALQFERYSTIEGKENSVRLIGVNTQNPDNSTASG